MTDADETLRCPYPGRQPQELLGRRVRFRELVGRVQEVDVLSAPHVVILTREGVLVRVPAREWAEIEVLR
jgi:hypothetical protein